MDKKSKLLIEKHNSDLFLRPRFTIDLAENHQEILNRFSEEFKKDSIAFRGYNVDDHLFISVAKKDEHFWSPQLHLEILGKTKKTALLKGLFGPKPQVWMLFMFVHFVIGISFLGFCAMLYARISLSESLFFPVSIIIGLPLLWMVLYFLGKIGKDTGKKQMHDLHKFMMRVIKN